jgi:hypothetical protein
MSFNNNNNNFYYNSTVDTKSYSYQKNCLTGPIQSSAIGAILFSALDAFQGVPIQQVIKPQKLGKYIRYITLHYITLLRYYVIITLLRYYVITLLPYYLITLLPYYVITLLRYYVITSRERLIWGGRGGGVLERKEED